MKKKTITIALALAGLLVLGPSTAVTIINVNTFDDEGGEGGGCSIREALGAAASDVAFGGCTAGFGNDVIQLQAGTYRLKGSLEIKNGITIRGASTTDADTVDPLTGAKPLRSSPKTTITMASGVQARPFLITGGEGVSLQDLTITGGVAADTAYRGNGGAIWAATRISLNNVVVTGNEAKGEGGAIFLSSVSGVEAVLTEISNNISARGAAAIGMTCYSAAAPDQHGIKLEQGLIYKNLSSDPDTDRRAAVLVCGDTNVTMTNATASSNDSAIVVNHTGLVPATATGISLQHVSILRNSRSGVDITNHNNSLNSLRIENSVVAFNGTAPVANCRGTVPTSVSRTMLRNLTGENCQFLNATEEPLQNKTELRGTSTDDAKFLVQFAHLVPQRLGGLTGVHMPKTTSVVAGALGSNDSCLAVDQRGAARNSANGRKCDVGAAELKELVVIDDTAANGKDDKAARSAKADVLSNDIAGENPLVDEDPTKPGSGTRFVMSSISEFACVDPDDLAAGSKPATSDVLDFVTRDIGTPDHPKPVHGRVERSADGKSLTYYPREDQQAAQGVTTSAAVACTYKAKDSSGAISANTAKVSFSISNMTPVASGDTFTREQSGDPISFNVVANDTDPDGVNGKLPPSGEPRLGAGGTFNPAPLTRVDCSARQLVRITTQPTLGTVSGKTMAKITAGIEEKIYLDGQLTYTPRNSLSPFQDSFQYEVLDSDCQASNVTSVIIKVNVTGANEGGGGSFDGLLLLGGIGLLGLRRKRRL